MQKYDPISVDMVIFGGTGDLSTLKLLPALYHRYEAEQICDNSQIICVSREYVSKAKLIKKIQSHCLTEKSEKKTWKKFTNLISLLTLDGTDSDSNWQSLAEYLDDKDKTRVFYLATPPSIYIAIAQLLAAKKLKNNSTRLVLEKPIGKDLQSAMKINTEVGKVFDEEEIYRIDHYLGKESVQNLLVLRFANAIFEPLWRTPHIDSVQITVSETLGAEGRADYYHQAGALRDMVQNHLLQLLCLTTMEAPLSLKTNDIRNEKVKVLSSLKIIDATNVKQKTVRGQYTAGAIKGEAVKGYHEELSEDIEFSDTETFVSIKAELDNWRWSGVPIYLRTGKRLARRYSEIVVQFSDIPHSIFEPESGSIMANQLIIRLQPDDGVKISMMIKEPGPGGLYLKSVPLNLTYADTFDTTYSNAYERLLMDVIRGKSALFMHREEVEMAWKWIDGILQAWNQAKMTTKKYPAGTNGPVDSDLLLDRDGRQWISNLT
jgi:glucose-6-phosphate 1-dehydrogenase